MDFVGSAKPVVDCWLSGSNTGDGFFEGAVTSKYCHEGCDTRRCTNNGQILVALAAADDK